MDTAVKIVKGKELTNSQLKTINEARKREFNSSSVIDPKPDNDDWEKIYFIFITKTNKNLLSFARLHDVRVTIDNDYFNILGIATLLSMEKRKGYGTKVLDEIVKYCKKENKIGLGFCNPNLSNFYRQRGFGILEKGSDRFVYLDKHGKVVTNRFGINDVIFVPETNKLIDILLYKSISTAYLSRPHW